MKYYQTTGTLSVPAVMNSFHVLSYDTLYYLKYPFTILWALIFFGTNYLTLRILTRNKIFLKILFIAYVLLFLIAALSLAYGYLFKERLQSDEYTLSRWLLGIAQSPLICLILLASEKLYLQSVKEAGLPSPADGTSIKGNQDAGQH